MQNGMTTSGLRLKKATTPPAQVVQKSPVTDETWEDLGETIRLQALAMIDQLATDGDPAQVLRGIFAGSSNTGACDVE